MPLARLLLDAIAVSNEIAPAPEEADGNSEYWPTSSAGLAVAGLFAWLAALISVFQIAQHIMNYEDPVIQRYYIRIIFIVPNYALCSFFSLAFPDAALYIDTMAIINVCAVAALLYHLRRQLARYEAFVIYTFMNLLLEYIGGPGQVEAFCRDQVVEGTWMHGTCCFPSMQVDGQFVKLCKRLILQFVILKPILATLTIILYAKGYYTEGDWSIDSSYLYIQVVYNFCYALALIGLIHFWAGTRELLKPYKPVLKFVTVKGIVFVTFWQGLILSLAMIGRPDEDAKQLQTWLLCIEMLPAAIMMWFAFPASQYMSAQRNREQGGIMMAVQNVGNVVMFTDVVTDFKHQFKPQYNTYTCYKDMGDEQEGSPAPSGQYRHATYIIRDPYQEQAIAERQTDPYAWPPASQMTAAMEAAGTSGQVEPDRGSASPVPVADFLGEGMDDVPLHDGPNSSAPVR